MTLYIVILLSGIALGFTPKKLPLPKLVKLFGNTLLGVAVLLISAAVIKLDILQALLLQEAGAIRATLAAIYAIQIAIIIKIIRELIKPSCAE